MITYIWALLKIKFTIIMIIMFIMIIIIIIMIIMIIRIHKQQFLQFDWLRACQLIPDQCKEVKFIAQIWKWVQKSVMVSAKRWNWKWWTAPTLSSDKQNGGQNLNEDWNSLSKLPRNKAKSKAQQQLVN